MDDSLIRRSDAIEAIKKSVSKSETEDALSYNLGLGVAEEVVKSLPSAEPKRYRGGWIDRSEGGRVLNPWWESHKCDQCGYCGSGAWNFCPNCGADMRGDEE